MKEPKTMPPGYVTSLKQWMGRSMRKAFAWSVSAHLVILGGYGIWCRVTAGLEVQPRRTILRRWETPRS